MEYNDVVKKLNDLIEQLKAAEGEVEKQERIAEEKQANVDEGKQADIVQEDIVDNVAEQEDQNEKDFGQSEDLDYTEMYLKTEEITQENARAKAEIRAREEAIKEEKARVSARKRAVKEAEGKAQKGKENIKKIKEEFSKTVDETLRGLVQEKEQLQKELEEKLSGLDYNEYLTLSTDIQDLQRKIAVIDSEINNIKGINAKEEERRAKIEENKKSIEEKKKLEAIKKAKKEKFDAIKKEFINEELIKLEERREKIEEELNSENDYMGQYLIADTLTKLQDELDEVNEQIEILKSGNFTKQQIDRAKKEIEDLRMQRTKLEQKMSSIDDSDYLSGDVPYLLSRVNERLEKLSVFNPDIDKLREEQETEMWEQYKKEKEDEKNKQIDEAFAEKEKMEKEEERKIAQATRQEIDLDMNTLGYPIVDKNLPGLKIVYDRANNTYVMTDESRAYNATYYFQSTYLKNKSKEMVLEDIGRIRGKEVMPYVLGEIDCNLYYCLSRFDRETGSHKAEEYIESLETGKQINDLEVTYDLRGNRRLSLINDFRQRRIANKSETAIGAKVEKGENKIIKAIKDLFKKVKTTSLPCPDMHLEDGKDINGQEIPSKDIDEKEDFSERIKVHQYSKPEIASYVNAFLTRNEQTEKRDITAASKAEYIQQLRTEGLSEDMITEISEKIEMQESKNNQTQGLNR